MQLLPHPYDQFPVLVQNRVSSRSDFGSIVGRRHFENVAAVARNRRIKRGSYSKCVHEQKR